MRQYTGEPIPKEKLDLILKAGLLAPSGKNKKPWELVVVQDKETLLQLSHCREGSAKMLEQAGCAILVFAAREKTDVWTEDCSIVMSHMHLMAHSLDLGSCWIQGRLRYAEDGQTTTDFCRQLLSVPGTFELEAILSLGIPKERPASHTPDEIPMDKIHYHQF